jgi:hypothetical protein
MESAAVQGTCSAQGVIVGKIIDVTPYSQLETAGGEPSGYTTYTKIRMKVLRDLRQTAASELEFTVRGEIRMEEGYNTVPPDTIQPIKGLIYAVAFWSLKEATPMWDAGTLGTAAQYYVPTGVTIPSEASLTQELEAFCADY